MDNRASKPQETLTTIAKENRALRWITIILSMAVGVSVAMLYIKPPQPVWLVTEDGQIMNGKGKVLSWEPIEASRRAMEIFLIPAENRGIMLKDYFSDESLEVAKEYKPQDKYATFKVISQEDTEKGGVTVTGNLFRPGKPDMRMSLFLQLGRRTEINPFGLRVSSTTIHEMPKEE